ncbi:MAG: DUF1573 domain-containing protein [Muribaculaceae bacterium]|nr:DUF1573 domain-containing protein [Muribaculaceae bacterium]
MFAALSTSISYAQIEKTLKFLPEEVDFGLIREENGKVTRYVKAVNISKTPTFIISARTSCGCSSVDYPDKQIAPGDTVVISVTYDPVNRPGKFLKTAKIYTGKERIGNSFKLKGNVIPSKKNLDRAYPVKSGKLRLSSQIINAGEVSTQEARPLFVGIYNDSDRSLKISANTDSTPLEAGLTPDSIGPFEISTLTLMLKGRLFKKNEKDFFYKAYLIDGMSGDTITSIPVGGTIRKKN